MRWFEHEENKVRGYYLKEPYSNIFVGCDPTDGMTKETACKFQAIVNVSDTECAYFEPAYEGQRMHWYPINEIGYWGYTPFFYIKKVLDHHYDNGDRVYLHCHAGAFRSPAMAIFWLVSRGLSFDDAIEIGDGISKEKLNQKMINCDETMLEYSKRRYFDSLNVPRNIFELYNRMNKNKTYPLASHLTNDPTLGITKEIWGENCSIVWKHKYFKHYYTVKWYLSDKKQNIMCWLMGLKKTKESKGCYSIDNRDGKIASIQRYIISIFNKLLS